ncbi:MAG: hypothetical protein AB7N91_06560 [Candidatus Tectimicrobiota bacterium]
MHIPSAPQELSLPIVTYWDGTPCLDPRLHGVVSLSTEPAGLRLSASLPHQVRPLLPPAPPLTRVANLWEYDVVECFLAGTAGYLEVEFGAGGHFLILAFSAPRQLVQAYETWQPPLTFEPALDDARRWRSSLMLPWTMIPTGWRGVNAYVSSRQHYLCYAPLPGPRADFHQPARFPAVRLSADI